MTLLCRRAERLTAENGGLRPGQWTDAIYKDIASNAYVSGTAVHCYDYLSTPAPGTAGGGGGGGLGLAQARALTSLLQRPVLLCIGTHE